jgi:hypothetical protein
VGHSLNSFPLVSAVPICFGMINAVIYSRIVFLTRYIGMYWNVATLKGPL